MAVQLGARPLADFTQPIEMLTDCHRRIEHFLGVLQEVLRQFGEGDLTEDGRRALLAALTYFAHAAPRHTADEERSLFPRLRDSNRAEAHAALAELDRLEQDHRQGEACHAQVDQLGRQWLETGRLDEGQRATMNALLEELAAMYAEHIRLEEQRVFVVASDVLQDELLREIGQEMRQRRSLPD